MKDKIKTNLLKLNKLGLFKVLVFMKLMKIGKCELNCQADKNHILVNWPGYGKPNNKETRIVNEFIETLLTKNINAL